MHCVPSYQFDCWNFLPFFWHQKAQELESGVRLPSGSRSGGSASAAAAVGPDAAGPDAAGGADDDGGCSADGAADGAAEAMRRAPQSLRNQEPEEFPLAQLMASRAPPSSMEWTGHARRRFAPHPGRWIASDRYCTHRPAGRGRGRT